MNFNEYQAWVQTTAIYDDTVYPVLGLAEEAGEVAGKVGKSIRDKTPLDPAVLAKELGDVLWMVSAVAYDQGLKLQDIVDMNVAKINSRKERGVLGGSGDDR